MARSSNVAAQRPMTAMVPRWAPPPPTVIYEAPRTMVVKKKRRASPAPARTVGGAVDKGIAKAKSVLASAPENAAANAANVGLAAAVGAATGVLSAMLVRHGIISPRTAVALSMTVGLGGALIADPGTTVQMALLSAGVGGAALGGVAGVGAWEARKAQQAAQQPQLPAPAPTVPAPAPAPTAPAPGRQAAETPEDVAAAVHAARMNAARMQEAMRRGANGVSHRYGDYDYDADGEVAGFTD